MNYRNNFTPSISDEEVFKSIEEEKKSIGYYDLVFQDTQKIEEYAKHVKQKNIVVIGIGGSSLGTYAIYKFLKYTKKFTKKMFFLETTDPIDILSKTQNINLEDTFFVVISKSGTTIETIAIFKYIHSLVECNKNNCVIVTENGSHLENYAKHKEMQVFSISKNVGGRFSVFSAVGLVPLALVGVDIQELLSGAKKVYNSFFQKEEYYQRLMHKARFFVEYKYSFNINVVFSYSSRLEGFNKWYIQLWGESLGKIDMDKTNQGLTPIGIIGPIDQHSFLQLIVEGRRDKTLTVIKLNSFESLLKIPSIELKGLEKLSYLDGLEFSTLINKQADATIESIHNLEDIPYDVINLEGVSESSIASLMYEYELLTSLCARFLNINAYDQPGVENGKKILQKKLLDNKRG